MDENAPSPMVGRARKAGGLTPRRKSGLSARNANILTNPSTNSNKASGMQCTPRSLSRVRNETTTASPVVWGTVLRDADEDEVFFGTPEAAESRKAGKLAERRNTMLYMCEVSLIWM